MREGARLTGEEALLLPEDGLGPQLQVADRAQDGQPGAQQLQQVLHPWGLVSAALLPEPAKRTLWALSAARGHHR